MGRKRVRLFLLPLLGVVVLGGCAPPTSYRSAAETSTANQVSFVRLSHDVAFAPGSTQLGEAELGRLAGFLQRQATDYGTKVAILSGGESAPAVARGQERAVAAVLGDMGFDAARIAAAAPGTMPRDRVIVLVSRYVVSPADCSYWSAPSTADHTNLPGGSFGCATERNLGLMVANPADLLGGRPAGSADGEYSTMGIQRYRAGETKPLMNENTGTGHGGG